MAERAVSRKLVSGPKSLIDRESTGKLFRSRIPGEASVSDPVPLDVPASEFPAFGNREMSANEDSPQNRKNRAVGRDAIEAHDLAWVNSPGLRLLCESQRSDRSVRT